jgi:hypothetical protein
VNPDTYIFHIARRDHPVKAVRRAAALEAKKQIERLKKLDLSDEDLYHRDLVEHWLEALHLPSARHFCRPQRAPECLRPCAATRRDHPGT